jgi:hypothetical protein
VDDDYIFVCVVVVDVLMFFRFDVCVILQCTHVKKQNSSENRLVTTIHQIYFMRSTFFLDQ